MQGNQSRQVILEKANGPVHDSEVAGQEGSTEPRGQSRPNGGGSSAKGGMGWH